MNSKNEYGSRIRVMIVEDQGMVRAFFERWLVAMPRFVVVASAGSGEAALALVEQARPDVMLVDHQRPGWTGWSSCRRRDR